MSADAQTKTDMEFLNSRPEFRRFLWRAIQLARIFDQAGSGSSERDLAYAQGRRDLGLDLLADAEAGQPAAHPEGIPIFTAIQIMREAAQQPTEQRKTRYDRHAEPDPDDDDQP
jgi:hypothetical protein